MSIKYSLDEETLKLLVGKVRTVPAHFVTHQLEAEQVWLIVLVQAIGRFGVHINVG